MGMGGYPGMGSVGMGMGSSPLDSRGHSMRGSIRSPGSHSSLSPGMGVGVGTGIGDVRLNMGGSPSLSPQELAAVQERRIPSGDM